MSKVHQLKHFIDERRTLNRNAVRLSKSTLKSNAVFNGVEISCGGCTRERAVEISCGGWTREGANYLRVAV